MIALTSSSVPMRVSLLFAAVLVAMIVALAFEEKIHAKKSFITGCFAVLSLAIGSVFDVLPFGPVINAFGESVTMPVYIPAVDWGVIAIIFGSSLFVDVVARSGLFTWIAVKLTKASGGDPWILLIYYGVMTVVFSAVLNNVTAMIIVGSLTGSLRKLGREGQLLGFLLVEGLLTNIGGLLTLISSVPNIIVGQAAGLQFVEFFIMAAPYVVVATACTIWLGARLFRVEGLRSEDERNAAADLVAGFDENDGIVSRPFFWFSAVVLVLFIAAIATTSMLPHLRDLGMGFVAVAFALILLARFKSTVNRFYQDLDWDLLLFFVFLFMVINVMEHAQVLALLGRGAARLVNLGPQLGPTATLFTAAVASAVTDNIPLAAMLAKILTTLETSGDSPLWWSVIFGANLGGNITPIGSASTVVAVTIMHKEKVEMSFARFVMAAAPYAALHLLLASIYVLLVVPHLSGLGAL